MRSTPLDASAAAVGRLRGCLRKRATLHRGGSALLPAYPSTRSRRSDEGARSPWRSCRRLAYRAQSRAVADRQH